MNGANIGTFDLNSPADSESMGLTDDRIRSVKSTLQQVIDDEHVFPTAGGSAVGYHRLGSARAYYDVQSNVSSTGTDGRLMLTSDTSRLFGVGSGGTVLLGGGPTALSLGSTYGQQTFPQRVHWVEEVGRGITATSSGSTLVTIPNSGYSGSPYVWVTPILGSVASSAGIVCAVVPIDGTSFVVKFSTTGELPFFWRSTGSRAL